MEGFCDVGGNIMEVVNGDSSLIDVLGSIFIEGELDESLAFEVIGKFDCDVLGVLGITRKPVDKIDVLGFIEFSRELVTILSGSEDLWKGWEDNWRVE